MCLLVTSVRVFMICILEYLRGLFTALSFLLIFINDMHKTCKSSDLIHYAKGTTAFLTGDDIALTLIRINDDLQHVH